MIFDTIEVSLDVEVRYVQKQIFDKILSKIKSGGLEVEYWDGTMKFYGPDKSSKLRLSIKSPKVINRMAKNVSLAFGEAYMRGDIETNLPIELCKLAYENDDLLNLSLSNNRFKKHNKNIKSRQKKLIEYHYDLGNDFYKLWLDNETLGYTCSYFLTDTDTLEQGQVQKFDHVLNKLQLTKDTSLLEIGFGWGYLLVRAAKRFGVKGFGVSLSKEQLKYAQALAKREKVDHLVTYKLMNYQDLPKLGKKFDRVVSVGFFEHVGRGNHDTYFKVVDDALKPHGISVLHCITQLSETKMDAWIDRYIFPGGYIPSIREVTWKLADYDFRLKDYENIGTHYIKTCREWLKRVEKNKHNIIKMYDEEFYRMWSFWLAGSIAAFETGQIDLSQWVFTKGHNLDWPQTREFLYNNDLHGNS